MYVFGLGWSPGSFKAEKLERNQINILVRLFKRGRECENPEGDVCEIMWTGTNYLPQHCVGICTSGSKLSGHTFQVPTFMRSRLGLVWADCWRDSLLLIFVHYLDLKQIPRPQGCGSRPIFAHFVIALLSVMMSCLSARACGVLLFFPAHATPLFLLNQLLQ